jgi:proprotein convertase subtilisin/kexin type 5
MPNYKPDPDSSNCIPIVCHHTCLTCVGEGVNDCMTAIHIHAHIYLYSAPNKAVCNDGYYHAPDAASCLECHATCGTCVGPNAADCLSCNDHMEL